MSARPDHRLFAAVYDPVLRVFGRRWLDPHRTYLADCEGRVLDLGCGTGGLFPVFADAIEAGDVELHAVEPDPHMRKRAEKRARKLDLDVRILPDAAEDLSVGDGRFDAVCSSLVFCTVADPVAAREEVHRVLRRGGEFRFFEHVHGEGAYSLGQRAVAPLWERVAGGCQLCRRTVGTLLAEPEFTPVDLEWLDAGYPPATPMVRGTLRRVDTPVW